MLHDWQSSAVRREDEQIETQFTLLEAAQRIGQYQWLESRLFELSGGWVQSTQELPVKLQLGSQSLRHAWHSELWLELLPKLREPEFEPSGLMQPASPGLLALCDMLGGLESPDPTVAKLVGLYRVLIPFQVDQYRQHLTKASKLAESPTIRSLGIVLADQEADLAVGEVLLSTMLGNSEQSALAELSRQRFKSVLIGDDSARPNATLSDADTTRSGC